MYDFTIYAFLAPTLSQLFFKPTQSQLGLALTFATFAIGFLVRPLGGILFGHIGDRVGRKAGLLATIFLMGLATVLIGSLPTYDKIGLVAPALLLLLRAIQGLCVGGDLPGGMTYLSEQAAMNCKGRYLGYLFAGINMGTLLAAGIVFAVHSAINSTEFQAWGWRIPFWGSIILSLLGLYHRSQLPESTIFEHVIEQEEHHRLPIFILLTQHRRPLIKAFCLLISFVLLVCQFFVYGPTYLNYFFHLTYKHALQLNCIASACYILSFIAFGQLIDKLCKQKTAYYTLLILIIAPSSYYLLLNFGWFLPATIFFAVCGGFFSIAMLVPFTELFPPSVRYTGIGVAYNVLFALGGTIPAILTATIPHTSNPIMLPIVFGVVTAVLYIVFLWLCQSERSFLDAVSESY